MLISASRLEQDALFVAVLMYSTQTLKISWKQRQFCTETEGAAVPQGTALSSFRRAIRSSLFTWTKKEAPESPWDACGMSVDPMPSTHRNTQKKGKVGSWAD